MAWGRFNPPTIGHETVFNEAARLSNIRDFDFRIIPTHTHDSTKNPLILEKKVRHLRNIFPRYKSYVIESGPRTIPDMIESLQLEYDNLVLIAGEDRVDEYHGVLNRVNNTFESVEIWSSGERDPDSSGVVGMSASAMREAASRGDIATFRSGLPRNTSRKLSADLFRDVREGLGLPGPAPVVLQREFSREAFYSAEFIPGDTVLVNEDHEIIECSIISVGTNYLEVESDGKTKKVWPHQVFC